MPDAIVIPELVLKSVCVPFSRTTNILGFNRRFKTASLGTGRFGSKPVVSFFSFCAEKEDIAHRQ